MDRRNFNVALLATGTGLGLGLTTCLTTNAAEPYISLLRLAKHQGGLGSNEHFMMQDVEHSFNYNLEEMHRLASMIACIVISHHGSLDRVPKGWEKIELASSTWPIYCHPDVGIDGLSSEQIRLILTGQIHNWAEVGGRNEAIAVIANRGMKFRGMRAVLFESQILTTPPTPNVFVQAPSYESMLENAQSIPGAFLIGLRRVVPRKLRAISIDDQPHSLSQFNQYPLQLRTNVLVRQDNERAIGVFQHYLRAIMQEKRLDETAYQKA